jgi:hypothetical protein
MLFVGHVMEAMKISSTQKQTAILTANHGTQNAQVSTKLVFHNILVHENIKHLQEKII